MSKTYTTSTYHCLKSSAPFSATVNSGLAGEQTRLRVGCPAEHMSVAVYLPCWTGEQLLYLEDNNLMDAATVLPTPCGDHFGSNCSEIIKLMPNPIKVLKSAKRAKGCRCERRENRSCKWHQAHWFCQRSAHVLKIETKVYFPSWNFANYWRCWGLMNQQCQTAGSQTLALHFNSLPCRQIQRRDGLILQVHLAWYSKFSLLKAGRI